MTSVLKYLHCLPVKQRFGLKLGHIVYGLIVYKTLNYGQPQNLQSVLSNCLSTIVMYYIIHVVGLYLNGLDEPVLDKSLETNVMHQCGFSDRPLFLCSTLVLERATINNDDHSDDCLLDEDNSSVIVHKRSLTLLRSLTCHKIEQGV